MDSQVAEQISRELLELSRKSLRPVLLELGAREREQLAESDQLINAGGEVFYYGIPVRFVAQESIVNIISVDEGVTV